MTAAWQLLLASEAARHVAWWCLTIGWLSGVGVVLAFGWRRIVCWPMAEELRMARRQHADDRRQFEARLGDAGLQIRELLGQNARLAALYTAAKADGTREVGRAMASGRKGAA